MHCALMTVSTTLVFIHPTAPSMAQSRSDLGIDKAKVPLSFKSNRSVEDKQCDGLSSFLPAGILWCLMRPEMAEPEPGGGRNRC